MNAWALLAIAVAIVVVAFWLAAELDMRLRSRRRERGLQRIYEEAQREVNEDAGVNRLRDGNGTRGLW